MHHHQLNKASHGGAMDSANSSFCSDDGVHDFGAMEEFVAGWGDNVDIDMLLREEGYDGDAWDSADVPATTDWASSGEPTRWSSSKCFLTEMEIERLQQDAKALEETLLKMRKLRALMQVSSGVSSLHHFQLKPGRPGLHLGRLRDPNRETC
ncbi:hypothetical protein FI667_g3020, partial [Globisporangium splendens]